MLALGSYAHTIMPCPAGIITSCACVFPHLAHIPGPLRFVSTRIVSGLHFAPIVLGQFLKSATGCWCVTVTSSQVILGSSCHGMSH